MPIKYKGLTVIDDYEEKTIAIIRNDKVLFKAEIDDDVKYLPEEDLINFAKLYLIYEDI